MLLCTDYSIHRIDFTTGREDWVHKPGGVLRGFGAAGHLLAYQTTDRKRGTGLVAAIDASDGKIVWTQGYDGIPTTRTYRAGEHIVFATTSPSRLYVFDLETGQRLAEKAPHSPGATLRFVHVSDNLIVTHANDRFIEAYEIPKAKIKWRVSLTEFRTELLKVRPEGLFLAGTKHSRSGEPKLFLARVDLGSGKIVVMVEDVQIGDPRFARLDADHAYVLTRDPVNRNVTLRAFRLRDLKEAWKVDIGGAGAELLPPEISKGHVLVPLFERGGNRKYRYSATLVDKSGKVVQNIVSGYSFERPPSATLSNDGVMFSVDNLVEVYK